MDFEQLHWKYNLKMTLTSCDQFPWYKKIDLYQLTIILVISLQEFFKINLYYLHGTPPFI